MTNTFKMQKVHINLRKKVDDSYDILIDRNLFKKIVIDLKKNKIGNKYAIITDSIVKELFGKKLLVSLKNKGLNAVLISFEAGEQSKNLETFSELIEKVFAVGLDRKSVIIALGGGVAGDIAGFVAACYMRGINYVQIPTSLLAMVDSSIGGKVVVDLKNGKNICGAFFQPKKVYIDVSLLKNLPEKEIVNGLAEIIKHVVIADKKLFEFIEENIEKIIKKDESILIKLIKKNCEIKARIVEKDEKEENLRKVVNYGHTIGHALESLTNFSKFSHGEAIAIGMAVEARIANKMKFMNIEDVNRQNALLEKAGLSIRLPEIETDKIISELSKDKKAISGISQFVLPEKIGKMKTIKGRYGVVVPENIIREALEESR